MYIYSTRATTSSCFYACASINRFRKFRILGVGKEGVGGAVLKEGVDLSKKTNKQTVECEVLALGSNEL